MSHTPHYDIKIKTILDALQPGERRCAALGTKWYMNEQEIAMYRKFNVPPSKYAPLTRMKLMNGHFVIFDIWYNQHADTGEPLVTLAHPASGIRVLPDKEWFNRDFSEQGMDLDREKPFFEQLHALIKRVPLPANYNYIQPENSLAFISMGDQDSYFVLACRSKRSFYAINGFDMEDSAEVSSSQNIRCCYNIVHSSRLFNCQFVRESQDCLDSIFLFDCRNCEQCFGATNKRNKKYLWFNEQLTKEEWEQRRAQVDLSSYQVRKEYEKRFYDLVTNAIWPENFNLQTEKSTGEYITKSTNIHDGYWVSEGSRDLTSVSYVVTPPSHDIFFASGIHGSSDCYYGIGYGKTAQSRFGLSVSSNCFDIEYCNVCYDCEHCFGCIGLRKKKFCILNKQYSEEEYWNILDALKCRMLDQEEYGDFVSMKLSPIYWKGSGAVAVFGATKEECLKLGALDVEPGVEGAEGPGMDPSFLRSLETIPDKIDETNKDILFSGPYQDSVAGRRFGYLKPEIALYEKLRIAPPREHPTRRINELHKEMNMPIFEEIICKNCQKQMRVAKNRHYQDRKVYCISCYLRFIEENG